MKGQGGVMKRILLILVMVIVATNVWAADKKKSKAAQSSKTVYSSLPFDDSAENLPVGFVGNSIHEIIAALEKNQSKYIKDEFETNDQFAARQEKLAKESLSGRLLYGSLLAFCPQKADVTKTYDAETGEMTLNLKSSLVYAKRAKLKEFPPAEPGAKHMDYLTERTLDPIGFEMASMKTKEAHFIGQNAYGAKAPITSVSFKVFAITAKSDKNILKDPSYPIPLIFKLSADEAKEAKASAGVILVGTLESPYISKGHINLPATISSPYELKKDYTYVTTALKSVWIYNTRTGKVYAKFPIVPLDK
jgi:hypothetical protein